MSRAFKAATAILAVVAGLVAVAPSAMAYPSGDPSYCKYAGPGDVYHNVGIGGLPTPIGDVDAKSRGGFQGTGGGANGNVAYVDNCASVTSFSICVFICLGGQYAGTFRSYRVYKPGSNCSIPAEYVEKNYGLLAPFGSFQEPCQSPLYDIPPDGGDGGGGGGGGGS